MDTTEWDKMLTGEYYSTSDPYVTRARKETKLRIAQLQSSGYDEKSQMDAKRRLLGTAHDDTYIGGNIHFAYGVNIHVGKRFRAGSNLVILDCARVDIGDNVICGCAVQIYTTTYPQDPDMRKAGLERARPVKIGNNVWIGAGTVILPGITIGNDVVIEPGAVVMEDVSDGSIIGGNPAGSIENVNNILLSVVEGMRRKNQGVIQF
ncbi:putative acetyltransferase [Zancudomyces culisetae]|uniref:Putative acetyltransferase n=1 Tax=Zancudomyces culisetae TaxID=1213189 RepID=A0A1R1PM66_ZANCU|nr:putative acetyltransferase [Zancudomyces culisetae]|eukprot:OMH82054.1 putative acetyltransferase [Zancudomyces culisetae]